MSAIRITKELINSVLGIGDDLGGDESVLSTINVRLDQLWREAVRAYPNVVCIHGDDLEKLITFTPNWKSRTTTFATPSYEAWVDKPVTDSLVRSINNMPQELALAVAKAGKLIFTQSPQFHYQRKQARYEISVWLHAVYAPPETGIETCNVETSSES